MIKRNQNCCTIYIVHHGQTDWNAQKITQGLSDIPLNTEGIKQATTASKQLKNVVFDAVFSSDLIRAKRTAEIITLEKKLAIQTTHLLRERCYGKYEGKPHEEMDKFYKTWESLSKKERIRYRTDDKYETDEEVISRFITFLREIAVTYPGKTILIVTHGGIMRVLLNHLSDITYLGGTISNTAYFKINSDGVDFFIEELVGVKQPK